MSLVVLNNLTHLSENLQVSLIFLKYIFIFMARHQISDNFAKHALDICSLFSSTNSYSFLSFLSTAILNIV